MKASISQFVFGILFGVLLTCVGFAWIGQRSEKTGGGSARIINVAHGLPVEHPIHAGIEEFGRELETLSGGTLKVNIFPGAQLGNETVCLEKTQQGEIDITKVSWRTGLETLFRFLKSSACRICFAIAITIGEFSTVKLAAIC